MEETTRRLEARPFKRPEIGTPAREQSLFAPIDRPVKTIPSGVIPIVRRLTESLYLRG